MISTVKIDISTIHYNIHDVYTDYDEVNFTLSWNEPFANFDPIVNYTVTIICTNDATCPVIVNTDNVTRTANVTFITDILEEITTISVTATNAIGTSDPAIRIFGGKLHNMYFMYKYVRIRTYICTMACMYVCMYLHNYCIFVCKPSFSYYACIQYAYTCTYVCIQYEYTCTYVCIQYEYTCTYVRQNLKLCE